MNIYFHDGAISLQVPKNRIELQNQEQRWTI